jgi:uncharacterized membrane protein YfcA
MMVIGVLLGLLVGAVLGLTGAGGGILAVPALVFGLGLDMRRAVPIALIAVGMGAALGAFYGLRRGTVRYKAALLMAAAGGLGSPLGVALARRLPADGLSALFAGILVWVGYRTYRQSLAFKDHATGLEQEKACKISCNTGRFVWTGRTAAILASIGVISGICTGMLGVGGGFIIVPALAHYTELRMQTIVPTSLTVIVLISMLTVASFLVQGLAITPLEWSFIGAVMVGMATGQYLVNHLATAVLQRGFAMVCLLVAGLLLAYSRSPI